MITKKDFLIILATYVLGAIAVVLILRGFAIDPGINSLSY